METIKVGEKFYYRKRDNIIKYVIIMSNKLVGLRREIIYECFSDKSSIICDSSINNFRKLYTKVKPNYDNR